MSNPNSSALRQLLHGYSVETTPGAATKIPDYRYIIEPGTQVYVTTLPGSTIDDTLTICERLKSEQFVPIPHIVARQIPNRKKLEDALIRFRDGCGGRQVLVLAGGAPKPVGEFDNSMQLLETELFDKMGIQTIGIAGHPEGSPDMSDQQIESALRWKLDFAQRTDAAMYIITQFCFEVEPIITWEARLSQMGIDLPLHIGIPGVATVGTLLKHAKACGIGASAVFLKKQARNATKMLMNHNPQRLLDDLVDYRLRNPETRIKKLHIYPLGGLRKSADWIQRIVHETDKQNISAA